MYLAEEHPASREVHILPRTHLTPSLQPYPMTSPLLLSHIWDVQSSNSQASLLRRGFRRNLSIQPHSPLELGLDRGKSMGHDQRSHVEAPFRAEQEDQRPGRRGHAAHILQWALAHNTPPAWVPTLLLTPAGNGAGTSSGSTLGWRSGTRR